MAEPVKSDGYTMDIVVPTHGHLDLTMRCFEALYAYTKLPFHLIVVDDSTDLTPLYLNQFSKEHNNVTYIHSDILYKSGNQIFNIGLAHCKTPFLATVMNSIRVEPEWEIGALQVMNANPKLGIVGFKCLFGGEASPQYGNIESNGIKMMQYLPCDMGRDLVGHRMSLVYECDAVQWAFAMLRVEAVKGILEEDVFHGFRGWDDIDNCFVVKKAGWQIVACGASVGYHDPRATRGTNSEQGKKENRENGERFYKRWGFWDEFIKQHPDGEVHAPPKMEINT